MKNKFLVSLGIAGGVILILLMISFGGIIGTNNSGYYLIKQAFGSGKMSVVSKPGWYIKSFAKLSKYSISDTYYFSASKLDGGSGADAAPISVRFSGGGTALVDGSVKYKMPAAEDKRLHLHEDFRSYSAVQSDLIRQYVGQVLKNTASIMKAEDSYSGRKGEFNALFEAQLREGIYSTTTVQIKKQDVEGNTLIETVAEIKLDSQGKPIIAVESAFKKYGVALMSVSIKDIDYDERIDKLIVQKQTAEQQKILARADAEKAKQDAITAEQKGLARVAEAEAEALVRKKTAIVNAEREKEVAQLEAQKSKAVAELQAQQRLNVAKLDRESAEQDAKALLVKKQAEAKANELLVKAGLTPKEKAEIEMQTRIGVARELAKVKVPAIVTGGGAGGGSAMDSLGIKMLLDINDKISKKKY